MLLVTRRRHPHVPLLRLANANVAEERWQAPSTYKAKVISITEQHKIWQRWIHLMKYQIFNILRITKGNHPVISWKCRSFSNSTTGINKNMNRTHGQMTNWWEILMFDQQILPDIHQSRRVTQLVAWRKKFQQCLPGRLPCIPFWYTGERDVIQATYLPLGFWFHTHLLQCF